LPLGFRLPCRQPRFIALALLVIPIATAVAQSAPAMPLEVASTKNFDLPADSADRSLRLFSSQSGCDVLFATQIAENIRSNAVSGDYLPQDAINLLLAGTGLTASQNKKTGAFTISR
jgi:hypothetical protein